MQRIRGVDVRRDVAALLDVHERQSPDLASVTAIVRQHLARMADIEREQFQPAKARDLVDAAQRDTTAALALEIGRVVDLVPWRAEPDESVEFPAELLHRLGIESTCAGIVALLHEAEANGQLRAFAPYAIQALKRLAGDEARLHRAPSATTAFHALSVWTAKVGPYGRARVDPDEDRRQRQRALRERALVIADVVGLRGAVEQRMRMANVPEPERTPSGGGSSGLVFGKYWQQ